MSPPMRATALIRPLGIHGFQHERRQVALGRVGDGAQSRERNPLFERKATRDQTFHVNRRGPRGAAQFRLGAGGQHRSVGGRHTFDGDAALRRRRGAAQATT